jgi:hypothetical protein
MHVSTVDDVTIHPAVERDSPSFRHTLLQLLVDSQNSDGGWGYHPSAQSATEATAWALCALSKPDEDSAVQQRVTRGKEWLLRGQLGDGSWPAFATQTDGCWATSLACLALNEVANDSRAVARGVDWLSQSWPRTPNFLQRLLQRLSPSSNITRQNNSLCGWAWTANTSSWVEPTSYALILMRRLPRERLSQLALKRRELAEAMLRDRMCPGGGWNSGNPLVYGVAGEPLVGPTVWALLALHDSEEKSQVHESLRWLEKTLPQIRGSVSIAVAHMCLEFYGSSAPPIDSQLQILFEADRFLGNVPVTALAALALDPARKLFPRAQRVGQL